MKTAWHESLQDTEAVPRFSHLENEKFHSVVCLTILLLVGFIILLEAAIPFGLWVE